ncbi:equilibrative nucleoside transporter 4 isoform X1 [Hetaerina americana]|uniref:equilibrative nucleoside transporter 4 isoform X1 n=1 Tax=Hetaerina americana TaxID=62018 RepID=UPI003A7F1310
MDENLSRGYIQLGKSRPSAARFSHGNHQHISPPVDKCNCIYLALVLAGVGFLLPYNSFIIAVDYFQARFPASTIVFDLSLVYVLVAFIAVLGNNLLVETLSLNTRITFGYVVSFITLLIVACGEVWWEAFGQATSYTINLIAVAVVSLGCTVQQSSFYGYTSMLPSRYTQAVMTGESAAGLLVSSNRILTKLLLRDERASTAIFFGTSVVFLGACALLHQAVRRTHFVRFYLTLCSGQGDEAANQSTTGGSDGTMGTELGGVNVESGGGLTQGNKLVLEPTEDVGLMDPLDGDGGNGKGEYGVLKLHQSPPMMDTDSGNASSSAFSFANPVYEPRGPATGTTGTTYKVEEVVVRMRPLYGTGGTSGSGSSSSSYRNVKAWGGIKKGLKARWQVSRQVWPYMVSIALAYFVTLCLYPGIISEVSSCRFGSWMPVLLMAIFNATDLIGKVLASAPGEWTRGQLVWLSVSRLALVPCLLACTAPRANPLLPGDAPPLLIAAALGLSNGLIGSLPIILAPQRVPAERRELTGNIMTLSYNIGLTTGSSVAYLLDAMLGKPLQDPCSPNYNYSPMPFTIPPVVSPATTAVGPTIMSSVPSINSTTPSMAMELSTAAVTSAISMLLNNTSTAAGTLAKVLSTVSQSDVGVGLLGNATVEATANSTVTYFL